MNSPTECQVSITLLEAGAHRGDPSAQLLLAERLAAAGEGDAAVHWLARAARTGHAQSFALLGAWQVLGYYVDRNPDEGVQRLEIAARHGDDTAAAFLACAFARGYAGPTDWPRALDWLVETARLGNARALVQVALLQHGRRGSHDRPALLSAAARAGFAGAASMMTGEPKPGEAGDLDWGALRASLDLGPFLSPTVPGTRVSESPAIDVFPGAVDPDWCRYVMGVAVCRLERAMVNEPHRGRGVHEMRTNSNMTIGPTYSDPLLELINERIARMAGIPASHQEHTTVLCYRAGESYEEHYDWFNPDVPQFREEIDQLGQRVATALVYLTTDYEGGETDFPAISWSFRGSAGDAIVWRNVRPDGSPEPSALHAGRPPISGAKWVLSKWIRSKPQPFVTAPRARPLSRISMGRREGQ